MTFTQSILFSVLDLIEYFIVVLALLRTSKTKPIYFKIGMILAAGITSGLFSHYIGNERAFVINVIMVILFINILFDVKPLLSLYIYVIATILLLLIQLTSLVIGQLFIMDMAYSFKSGLVGHSLTVLLLIPVYKFLPIHILMNERLIKNRTFSMIAINIFMLSVGSLIFWYTNSDVFLINAISFAAIFLLIMVVNLLLFTRSMKSYNEQKELETYEKYMLVIEELMGEIRARQHEYDNHIQCIQMMLNSEENTQKKIEEMSAYVEDVDMGKDLGNLAKLDNKLLAGFIYSKKKVIESHDLIMDIDINNYLMKTKLKPFMVIEIIGTLLDNAMEATATGGRIKLGLYKEEGMNVIEVINEHPYLKSDQINKMFDKGFSTKSDDRLHRGYGLYNLAKIVKKNGGHYSVENMTVNQDNQVCIRVYVL
ncbi:MAG: GHKL domain-containing protein [Vallitaleaceae bacterium]|nr:GHKL domain-containing protein [Vallitaleaceae bacterium]